MPSKAAQGDRKLGATGCWGTLWSEERLVASLKATPRSGVGSGAKRIPVFWAWSSNSSSPTTVWCADFKVYPCTAVATVVYNMTLFFSPAFKSLSIIRSELITLEASVVLSGRAVSENPCVRGRGLFREGLRSRRVFDWG